MTSTAPHTLICPPGSATVTGQLDREWAALRRRPNVIRHVRSWATEIDPALADVVASIESLDDLVAATHRARGHAAEHLLRELVGRAAHDRIAGRVVVQRLLPGVLSATRRYSVTGHHTDPIAEAVGALWISIASFDGAGRHGPVAPSIISDTMFAAFRRRLRVKSAGERPIEPQAFDDRPATPSPCPLVELADLVREARRAGVPTDDLDLIRHLVRAGSPSVVAAERRVTTRTVRNHRRRAVDRVRAAVAA